MSESWRRVQGWNYSPFSGLTVVCLEPTPLFSLTEESSISWNLEVDSNKVVLVPLWIRLWTWDWVCPRRYTWTSTNKTLQTSSCKARKSIAWRPFPSSLLRWKVSVKAGGPPAPCGQRATLGIGAKAWKSTNEAADCPQTRRLQTNPQQRLPRAFTSKNKPWFV